MKICISRFFWVIVMKPTAKTQNLVVNPKTLRQIWIGFACMTTGTIGTMLVGCAPEGGNWENPLDKTEFALPDNVQEQAITVCADGETVRGIDVSKWQGDIDWDAVAAAGVKFAVIRVSHGLEYIDEWFADNWSEAKRVGILRGAYQFANFSEDPAELANLFVDLMGPLEPGDLPPVYDIESTDGQNAATIVARAQEWVNIVEQRTGARPTIYTGKYFWQDNVASSDAFVNDHLWVAQYRDGCPDLPSPWTRWTMWQNSSTGRINGISGNVDTNFFNGNYAALLDYAVGEPSCGDAICNGDETNASCPSDCPVCESVPASGRVIDERDLCFEKGGPAQYMRSVDDAGSGSHLYWTHTTDNADAVNYGKWNLRFQEGGRYRLEVYTDAAYAESKQTIYRIRHAGVEETVTIDQTAQDGWAILGEYAFAAGEGEGGQFVWTGDNTGEPGENNVQMVFDDVKVTRVSGGSVDPNADGGVVDGGIDNTDAGDTDGGGVVGDDAGTNNGNNNNGSNDDNNNNDNIYYPRSVYGCSSSDDAAATWALYGLMGVSFVVVNRTKRRSR